MITVHSTSSTWECSSELWDLAEVSLREREESGQVCRIVACHVWFCLRPNESMVTGSCFKDSSFLLNLKDKCSVWNQQTEHLKLLYQCCPHLHKDNFVLSPMVTCCLNRTNASRSAALFSLAVAIRSSTSRQSFARGSFGRTNVAANVSKKAEPQSRKSVKVQKLILVPSCSESRTERTENTAGPEPKPTDDTLKHAVKHQTLCFLKFNMYINGAVRSRQLFNGELMIFFLRRVQIFLHVQQQLATPLPRQKWLPLTAVASRKRPSQLISHQHPPFHNKNVLLHSRFSVEYRRRVATALIAQTRFQSGTSTRRPCLCHESLICETERKKEQSHNCTLDNEGKSPHRFFFSVWTGSYTFGLRWLQSALQRKTSWVKQQLEVGEEFASFWSPPSSSLTFIRALSSAETPARCIFHCVRFAKSCQIAF